MPSLPSPQESLAGANVIKWTEVLPRSRNTVAAHARRVPANHTGAAPPAARSWSASGLLALTGFAAQVPPPRSGPRPAVRSARPGTAVRRRPPDEPSSPAGRRERQWPARAGRGAKAGPSGRAAPRQFGQAGQYGQTGSGRRDAVDGTERQASVGTADGAGAWHQVDPQRQADTGRVADPGQRADDGSRADPGQRADTGSRADPGQRADDGRLAGGDGSTRPAWPSQFAQVLAETLAGSRPPRQLTPWTTERARGHIRRLGPTARGQPGAADTANRRSTPSSGVVEMAVVVRFGPRVHALAVRLERGDSSHVTAWQCTAIEAA